MCLTVEGSSVARWRGVEHHAEVSLFVFTLVPAVLGVGFLVVARGKLADAGARPVGVVLAGVGVLLLVLAAVGAWF